MVLAVEYKDDVSRIADLNDSLRKTFTGGMVMATQGVDASPYRGEILKAVREYDGPWTEDNDPYQEHDFAKLTLHGEDYFFKIDYYDLNLELHSPNKADPKVTKRVLTIMKATEY